MFILHLEKYYRRIVLLSHVVFISVIGASSSNTGKSSSVSQQGVHPSHSWVFMQATDGSFSELEGVFIYVTGVSSFGSQKCLLLSSRVVLFHHRRVNDKHNTYSNASVDWPNNLYSYVLLYTSVALFTKICNYSPNFFT